MSGYFEPDPNLSIIIANWNTKELLRDLLYYLSVSQDEWKVEIVVVDNGSTDGSVQMVTQHFPYVTLLPNTHNVGFARANNQGINIARGRHLLLLNSDVRARIEDLHELVLFMDDNPKVGALSPQLMTVEGKAQAFAFGSIPTLRYLFVRRLRQLLGLSSLHDWDVDKILTVDWVSGACLCVRREVIEQIGLLDENFFLYFEDVDWCLRMRQAGWQVIYNPTWSVVHLGGGSQTKQPGSSHLYYQSLLYFYQKHYPGFPTFILRIALALYCWLVTHLPVRT